MIPFKGGQEERAIGRPVFLVTVFHVKHSISALQKQCCTSIVGSSLATMSAATILSQNRDDIVSAKEQCCDRFVRRGPYTSSIRVAAEVGSQGKTDTRCIPLVYKERNTEGESDDNPHRY